MAFMHCGKARFDFYIEDQLEAGLALQAEGQPVEQGPVRVILGAGDTPFPSFDRDELARFFDGTTQGAT